jgi:hypothetical protein
MNTNYENGVQKTPTMNLAINNGRVKLYNKDSALPTYYLKKGQEFQIELFNPTNGNILAKISLNDKPISNGGLVLRPGERIFLDRFLDKNKKFLFDTYEVDNTAETKAAIKDNGDIKVTFYRETVNRNYLTLATTYFNTGISTAIGSSGYGCVGTNGPYGPNGTMVNYNTTTANSNNTTFTSNTFAATPTATSVLNSLRGTKTLDSTIETGRVESGSKSDQKLKTVEMDFDSYSFHTITYKLLPISQMKVSTNELRKVYCTECGTKNKSTNKFCPSCGQKQ